MDIKEDRAKILHEEAVYIDGLIRLSSQKRSGRHYL